MDDPSISESRGTRCRDYDLKNLEAKPDNPESLSDEPPSSECLSKLGRQPRE